MKRVKFKKLLSELKTLTYKQKQELLDKIKVAEAKDIILGDDAKSNCCKHCSSKHYVKWGKESGLQRYKCKSCNKTYNQLTNSPLAKLHKKEEWLTIANPIRYLT